MQIYSKEKMDPLEKEKLDWEYIWGKNRDGEKQELEDRVRTD